MISEERLQEDQEILQRLNELQRKVRTEEEEKEFHRLYHRYYVENNDIRVYWKTY